MQRSFIEFIAGCTLVLVSAGCGTGSDSEPTGAPASAATFEPAPQPDPVSASLPVEPDGTVIVFEQDDAQLAYDPDLRDPITALGDCANWLIACVTEGGYGVDECVASVRVCTTQEPWNEAGACCSAACVSEVEDRRQAGEQPLDAVLGMIKRGSCVPGFADLVRE